MITKERLKELIKEGATIWSRYTNSKNEPIAVNLKDTENFIIYQDLLSIYDIEEQYDYQLDDLFETKKQAEWYLKYHKTRTEELDLPMWEDWKRVNKVGIYAMSFRDKKHHYCELMVFHDEIKVTKQAYGLEVLFDEPNTEENYIKACDLCLKLFKGEE